MMTQSTAVYWPRRLCFLELSGVSSEPFLLEADRGSPGSGPNGFNEDAREIASKLALEARVRTKIAAAHADFVEEVDVEGPLRPSTSASATRFARARARNQSSSEFVPRAPMFWRMWGRCRCARLGRSPTTPRSTSGGRPKELTPKSFPRGFHGIAAVCGIAAGRSQGGGAP